VRVGAEGGGEGSRQGRPNFVTAVPSCPGVTGAPRVSFIITNDIPLCSVDTCRNITPSNANVFTFFLRSCDRAS
jgi:hypothetical protein